MSVGLPGSGIGGIFYIASALSMPFVSATRALRERKRPRLALAIRQALLALGIIVALYATGWALSHLIVATQTHLTVGAGGSGGGPGPSLPRIFQTAALALTFGTLAIVLFSVQVMRFVFARRTEAVEPVVEVEEERAAA